MSRHKLVKALDLDEELDDFDGGVDSDFEEEVSAEDKERLRTGIVQVRSILGDSVSVTNTEIEDSLWHYYYDVDKTVNYLRSQTSSSQAKQSKKTKVGAGEGKTNGDTYSRGFSAFDFFKDSPWFNVPRDRLAEILIEPLHPQGGLLGGTSKQDGAPKSKLAALAAARKQKENQKLQNDQNTIKSVALLDRLGEKSQQSNSRSESDLIHQISHVEPSEERENIKGRRYPVRKATNSDARSREDTVKPTDTEPTQSTKETAIAYSEIVPAAAPSVFARTMFHSLAKAQSQVSIVSLPQESLPSTEFNFSGPSPDDIVLKAQNSKGPTPKLDKQQPQQDKSLTSINDVAQAIKDSTIDEPKVKGKNLNVLAEFEKSKPRNAANFVVIGHVDAGKSTLMGRLLHDLGVVDTRTVDKYRKESERLGKSSFALAWVLDQGTEERERGVTIDIAMNKFETQSTSFTILDAPGHRDFIPNMIAGASQADFAVLVIDASTGNFESGLRGQTKEHTLLARSIGVQKIVIAINKLDTVQWSRDRYDEISQQVSAFLTGAGFLHKNLAFVPCVGLTGENIVKRISDPNASWYSGPPLITLLESSEPFTRALEKPLRMTIDDIFRGGVQNPLSVSGRLDAGSIQIGDTVLIAPANQTASIKGVDVDSEPKEWAVAGQNVILHLADIEAKYLKSGDVICPPSAPIQSISTFTVKVLAFVHITPMRCEIHKGRLHAPGRVINLAALLDKASGAVIKGKKPRLIKPGNVARILLEVEDPIPLELGGRVIIRAGGETVGAGLVE